MVCLFCCRLFWNSYLPEKPTLSCSSHTLTMMYCSVHGGSLSWEFLGTLLGLHGCRRLPDCKRGPSRLQSGSKQAPKAGPGGSKNLSEHPSRTHYVIYVGWPKFNCRFWGPFGAPKRHQKDLDSNVEKKRWLRVQIGAQKVSKMSQISLPKRAEKSEAAWTLADLQFWKTSLTKCLFFKVDKSKKLIKKW